MRASMGNFEGLAACLDGGWSHDRGPLALFSERVMEALEPAHHSLRGHAVLVKQQDELGTLKPGKLDNSVVSLAYDYFFARRDNSDRRVLGCKRKRIFQLRAE